MSGPAADRAFEHLGIAGLGLIGGSVAIGARTAWPGIRITAVDTPAVLERASRAGAIDAGRAAAQDLAGCDVIVLAAPVADVIAAIAALAAANTGAVVTDVASTKRDVMRAAEASGLRRFVGGHPMAGAARGGFEHARADLFRDRPWIVVAGRGTDDAAVEAVEAFARGLGARPARRDAAAHDHAVASLSHLPQLVAIALMNVAARACPAGDLPLAGQGFHDMTRLASSPGDLWQSILASNADEVGDAARGLVAEIARLVERARTGDVAASFAEANQHRDRLDRADLT